VIVPISIFKHVNNETKASSENFRYFLLLAFYLKTFTW